MIALFILRFMKYYQQFDYSDCGAACLAMISSFFGKEQNIAKLRKECGTEIEGTNILGILNAAKKNGLQGYAVKGEKNSLNKSLHTPFIALINVDNDIMQATHFVVIKKITNTKIIIYNPDPLYKKQKLSYEEFFRYWTGYAIFCEPEVGFKKSDKKENLLFKFIPVFLPHKKLLAFSFLSSILLLAFGIITSFYYKYIFDEVVYAKAAFSLHTLSLGVLLVTVIQSLVGCVRSILLSHFSVKTDLQLNFSYLSHIFNLPLSFFESRKSGEILSRLGDLDKIKQTLSNAALSGVMDAVMLLVSGPILFGISGRLFGISIATVLLVSIISMIFAKIYRSYYSKTMSQNADVQSYLYESLNGVATVKALNAEQIVNEEYEKKKMTAVNTSWTLNKFGISQSLITGLINGISGILVYWIGCSSIIGETMSFGTLVTFNSLLGYFSGPLFRLVNIQNSVQEALVAAERVGEILELEKEKDENRKYLVPEKINGHIKFEDVTFAYGSRRPVYEHLNLEIAPGSWTAFVGPSGCGKSTFVKLILKFYEAQEGKIFLDGNDIRDIDSTYLRSKIGYVPQDIFLFSGTVAENISLHNQNATLEEIMEAAKKAGADEFIQKLPKRYDTVLGEHGGGLSGGEKQRLALARALLGNPSFLILDEATSSLDTVSEMEIHKVIKNLRSENIAVILIAHRLTTVMNCDKIFVMKDGKIIQSGSHKELLKEDGLYKEMWSEVNS